MEEQIPFVRADLADNPRLLALKSEWDELTNDSPGPHAARPIG